MKRLILVAVIVPLISIVLPLKTYAAEPCFSSLADSAWQNGEPSDVRTERQKNNITLRFNLTPNPLDGSTDETIYSYENLPMKATYEYLGNACSIRKILIEMTFNPNLEYWNDQDLSEFINNSYRGDAFVQQEVRDAFVSIKKDLQTDNNWIVSVNKLNQGKIMVPAKLASSLRNFKLKANSYSKSGMSWRLNLEILGKCGEFIEKKPHLRPITFVDDDGIKKQIKFDEKNCSARLVATYYNLRPVPTGNPDMTFSALREIASNVQLGEINLQSMSSKLSVQNSITCIKGKTTKKVSGTNPKCPKGYKVKA